MSATCPNSAKVQSRTITSLSAESCSVVVVAADATVHVVHVCTCCCCFCLHDLVVAGTQKARTAVVVVVVVVDDECCCHELMMNDSRCEAKKKNIPIESSGVRRFLWERTIRLFCLMILQTPEKGLNALYKYQVISLMLVADFLLARVMG